MFIQGHRNLSQLPNFTFSVALAYYHQSLQDDLALEEGTRMKQKADQLLQDALIMFPGGEFACCAYHHHRRAPSGFQCWSADSYTTVLASFSVCLGGW